MTYKEKVTEQLYKNTPERFRQKLTGFPDPDKCWVWSGGTTKNYPYFRDRIAYRYVWESAFDEHLERGESIQHTCGNKLCCNPFHLKKVSFNELRKQQMKDVWKAWKESQNVRNG